ncbi:MAG: hypothetical protein HZA11_00935 [Nitrospirae bacterium]|nr:hypothetical protein [Nitrospirota bacterium]
MNDINWLPIVAALIGGGAAGAIITAIISTYRSRRQPIGRRIDIVPVFRQSNDSKSLRAKIAIAHENKINTFENLFLAEVQIVNRGNSDLQEFIFGVTLGKEDRCIFVETIAPDRHHNNIQTTLVTPDSPRSEIDFRLSPFNRGDSYALKMYVVIPADQMEPQEIKLGSPSPVKFIDMPTIVELLSNAALKVGPIRIGVGWP